MQWDATTLIDAGHYKALECPDEQGESHNAVIELNGNKSLNWQHELQVPN